MTDAAILSTGSYVPENTVHNETLDQFTKASQMLISQKTGVISRRHAGADQCTSDLALQAALRCLQRIDFSPGKLEAIMLSTSSPDRIQPATAVRLQHLLGAVNAFAFDINSVCSGSTYGIALSRALIRSGMCTNVLFVAAELYSKILNPKDFATFPYFGDGSFSHEPKKIKACLYPFFTPMAASTRPSAFREAAPCCPSTPCRMPKRPFFR